MLQYLPQDRMTIAEIKEHPWYTKPIPSESEVLKEFESRYNRIHSATGSGDLPSEVDQSIYTDSKHAHRGEDDGSEDAKMPTLERTCKEYEPVTKITQFFSTFDPKKLYDALALFSESMQALDF
jgi:hypothetical protein